MTKWTYLKTIAPIFLAVTMAAGCLPAVDGPTRTDGTYDHNLSIGELRLDHFPVGGYGMGVTDTGYPMGGNGYDTSGGYDTSDMYDTSSGQSVDPWCEQLCACLVAANPETLTYEDCIAVYILNPDEQAACEEDAATCLSL